MAANPVRKPMEFTGRTVEEATQKGLARMSLPREKVAVEILEQGKAGFLGLFGGTAARVLLRPRISDLDRVEEIARGLLDRMGFQAPVRVSTGEGTIDIEIGNTGSDGLLIGKKGETLMALQHIISRMASHEKLERCEVNVDIAGYRRRRETQLAQIATNLAAKAVATGERVMTEALTTSERRVVHLALAKNNSIKTQAIGEGLMKKVVIFPARGGRENGNGGR
jgi:spoIIIJ-associated protein